MKPLLILICLIISSCTQTKENKSKEKLAETVNQLKPVQKLKFARLDTTILKEENTLLGVIIEQKLQENNIALRDTSHPFYSVFDINKGKLTKEYSNKNVKNIVFPNISPNGLSMTSDKVYILYSWVNKIFVLTIAGDYIKTIKLDYPNLNKLTSDNSKNFFEYDSLKKIFIVSSTYPSLGISREKYSQSHIISIFDEGGNFLRSFAKYPESYTKGGVLGDFKAVYQDGYIYVLFRSGYEKIQKYNIQGELIEEYDNSNHKFNYNLNYFKGKFDPFNAPRNDSYEGFAVDNSDGKLVFYMDYYLNTVYAKEKRRERHLIKYNVTDNVLNHFILPKGINLVSARNNQIYMYSDSNEMHEIMLIKYEIR